MNDSKSAPNSTSIAAPRRGARWLAVAALLLLTLVACGKSAAPTPAPAPPTATVAGATQPATSAATQAVATAATTVSTADSATPSAGASPVAGETTVGQLADRIGAAWGTVRTYRATTVSTVTLPASPVAASPIPRATPLAAASNVTIDENVLPDRRHIVQLVNGQSVVEYLIVGGEVWVRGPQAPGVTPAATPDAWVAVGATPVASDNPFAGTYAELAKPVGVPYAGLSQAERERIAHPAGTITVNGRSCAAYRAVDTTMTGERIDVTIAIADAGLPCSIETRSGSSDTVTTFEYNIELTIDAPSA